MRCEKCERPADLCECVPFGYAEAGYQIIESHLARACYVIVTNKRVQLIPKDDYAGAPVERHVWSDRSESLMDDDDSARQFAAFLNSDAIFECQVPREFLK